MGSFWLPVGWAIAIALVGAAPAGAQTRHGAALLATHERLKDTLAQSPLQRPIHLESAETADGLKGEVFAEVDYPLATIAAALNAPARWCEAMMPHINTRQCQASGGPADGLLALSVVRKYDQPLEQAFRLTFNYRVAQDAPDYFATELTSDTGPLGTSHYRILVEAVPVADTRSFIHFTYAYDSNALARFATQAYLAMFGSAKVGFSVVAPQADGTPEFIRGIRGLMERNAMRYFLAIEAHLSAAHLPSAAQAEKRLAHWFAAAEQYPRQLHEIDRATYLDLKRADAGR